MLERAFWERIHSNKNFIVCEQLKMVAYFYKETIIYPFVAIELMKKELKLENQHYTDVLTHVQETGYSQLKCYISKVTENGI